MGNMATEIVAFLLTISGWILISSTVPTDYWKVSSVDGTVITTATFWSNLWKTCVTDSTGVSNCKDFMSMLALDVFSLRRFELGAALFIGWSGSVLCILGGLLLCLSLSESFSLRGKYSYTGAPSFGTTHNNMANSLQMEPRELRKHIRNAYV
ncbi:claudin-10-like [Poecilia latipinna]|uniref:claudin-10-like n=1 Tax=Poecilia latipinna TaxID=48699 RepID=UPI00072DA650|nr:PREDICTED: claudin-10-like [Poecilia latipinna]